MGFKIDEIPKLDDDITTDRQSNVMIEVQLAMRIYLGFGATVCLLMLPAGLVAQTGGQPGGEIPTTIGGGEPPIVAPAGGPIVGPTTTADFASQPTFDIGRTLEEFAIQPEPVEFENLRLQPFVGRSTARYFEQELVHPRSLIDPTGGGTGGVGGRTGSSRFTGRQTGPGTGTQQNGFEIARFGLRTRVIPQIVVQNRPTTQQVSARFQQRLARIPSVAAVSGGINVTMNGRTAILTGTVADAEARERIERLTRLEPGVSRIDNRITVSN